MINTSQYHPPSIIPRHREEVVVEITLSMANGDGFSITNGRGGPKHRKVMVVADPSHESAIALRYVLSHVIVEKDILYLLHVECPTIWKNGLMRFKKQSSTTPTSREEGSTGIGGGCTGGCIGGNFDFLEQMTHACQVVHPKLKVKVVEIETDAKDKANEIISQANMHGIDLLVIGKRQSLSTAILGQRMNGSIRGETAEYLLENSKCKCVAVQRKGQTGGYILHTKSRRNFWLLA